MTEYAKANPWMVSTLVLIGVVAGFGVSQIPYFKGAPAKESGTVAQQQGQQGQQAAAQQEPPAPVLTEDQVKSLPDDDPSFGDANAPITVVEFSDFQCPYCSRFFKLTLPSIEENYIKTGKVRLVYRDFPLDIHPQSMTSAIAAECANDQGKFKEMHDMLFDQQQLWSNNDKAVDVFKDFAKKIGLDTKQFSECYGSQKHADEIRKDLVDGAAFGVNGTPGFFINGKTLSGAMPFDLVFKPIFDAVLAGKKWEVQYDALGKPSVKVL